MQSQYKPLTEAYIYYCSNDVGVQRAVLGFEMWCEKRKDDNPQFAFWYMILAMELTTLSLVRAFTLRVQSHIEIRLPSRTTLFKAPPPSVSGD